MATFRNHRTAARTSHVGCLKLGRTPLEIFRADHVWCADITYIPVPFADRVLGAGVAFSMDGRGRFLDNIFIERLWRSLKYEAVYLHELRDGAEAGRLIGTRIDFYNEVRPHSALAGAHARRDLPQRHEGDVKHRITTGVGGRPRETAAGSG